MTVAFWVTVACTSANGGNTGRGGTGGNSGRGGTGGSIGGRGGMPAGGSGQSGDGGSSSGTGGSSIGGRGGMSTGATGGTAAGGTGGTQAGRSGSAGGCPTLPPGTNDPACPDVSPLWSIAQPIDGACTPGLMCQYVVSTSSGHDCTQGFGYVNYACCKPSSAFQAEARLVPALTDPPCPALSPNQDPRCVLPFADPCPAEGLTCNYRAPRIDGAGGIYGTNTSNQVVCCSGSWLRTAVGEGCPVDAGAAPANVRATR